jgi:hypothetical protein
MLQIASSLAILLTLLPGALYAQRPEWLFPSRSSVPELLAGPRNPVNSAALLGVVRNPSAHGSGVEAELSIGSTLPVFLLGGTPEEPSVVLGVEAVAYARFALQVLQREMVATDWVFAVPAFWHHRNGWTRLAFFHSSSHLGDEYNRRFGDPGVNVSRDGLEILAFRRLQRPLGGWVGVRYGYNPHPDDDQRWVLRTGAQMETRHGTGLFRPFVATDIEFDQEAGMRPRVEARIGSWLPEVDGRRALRFSLVALNGPTPLGQFRFRSTTQVGLSLLGSF